jgi:prepilin-type N-terminal cleavage/methylation domain-containing protein
MNGKRGGRGGFTLIELLVVIGIIAVLAAIILPVYNSSQERARQTQCLANLHGIGVALKLYKNDYRQYPQGCLEGWTNGLPDNLGTGAYANANYNITDLTSGERTRISALYKSYVEEQKGIICPDEDGETLLVSDPTGGQINQTSGGAWQDPAEVLQVGQGSDGSASSYDDFYNAFGYINGAGVVDLGMGTPQVTKVATGRRAKQLENRYAPNDTLITTCREHETNYAAADAVSLAVRVGGSSERIIRATYDWESQAEQEHE